MQLACVCECVPLLACQQNPYVVFVQPLRACATCFAHFVFDRVFSARKGRLNRSVCVRLSELVLFVCSVFCWHSEMNCVCMHSKWIGAQSANTVARNIVYAMDISNSHAFEQWLMMQIMNWWMILMFNWWWWWNDDLLSPIKSKLTDNTLAMIMCRNGGIAIYFSFQGNQLDDLKRYSAWVPHSWADIA